MDPAFVDDDSVTEFNEPHVIHLCLHSPGSPIMFFFFATGYQC